MIEELIFDDIKIIYKENLIHIVSIAPTIQVPIETIAIINPEQQDIPEIKMIDFKYWGLSNRTRHNVDSAIYYIISKYYE